MKIAHISKKARPSLLNYIQNKGYEINLIQGAADIEESIRNHPDIYMCKLSSLGNGKIIHCLDSPKSPYPFDISYNGVCLGNYFIHNLQYTAKHLLDAVNTLKMKTISVKQGYTKCNMVILNEKSAITSDHGIYNTLKEQAKDLDILLIKSKFVDLPGHRYGFLGGASGKLGDTIVFHGDLEAHPDFELIRDFIKSKNLEIKFFPEFPLTDIGSIIEEELT